MPEVRNRIGTEGGLLVAHFAWIRYSDIIPD